MDFLQRVLDSFSRGGVDLFRLRTGVSSTHSGILRGGRGMYSGFVTPLNVPHDHFYLDGDSPPAAAFQHSISEVQSFWGTARWAIAALLQAEYIPCP